MDAMVEDLRRENERAQRLHAMFPPPPPPTAAERLALALRDLREQVALAIAPWLADREDG